MYSKHLLLVIITWLLLPVNMFSQTLQLMTYNIRLDVESDGINKWNNRATFFTGQIKFYEPDILGIQESVPGQVNYLDSSLGNYKYVGIGREGLNKGESSPVFYNFKRLKLVQQNTFWLSETPEKVSKGWDASYLRVCTYALFIDRKSKKRFWIFNTHLDNNGVVAREKSVELILKTIDSVNTQKLPVFFMGDFNATPETKIVTILKKSMDDSRESSLEMPFGPNGTFNNFEFNKPVTMLIDYIFISRSPGITVNKYAVLSDSYDLKYPSDHLPVFVQVELNPKRTK